MGQFEHQPCLPHVLHPGADEGHKLANEEEPKISVAKGTEECCYR
jgi:hypothetical protein